MNKPTETFVPKHQADAELLSEKTTPNKPRKEVFAAPKRTASRKAEPTQTSEEDKSAYLSTTGRLMAYNQQLKHSLNNGLEFTKLLDLLINTKDKQKLLDAVFKLTTYQLDTAYLVFPQQYSVSDYYLMFLNRLLSLHDYPGIKLNASDARDELFQQVDGIEGAGYFTFHEDKTTGGAYYCEDQSKLKLFYVNFDRHVLRFNNDAIWQLLVVNYGKQFDYPVIKRFANFLLAVGNCLKASYGFDVDFGLLDPSNSAVYSLKGDQTPKEALDRLFIAAANAGFMLVAGKGSEAVLKLKDGEIVTVYDKHDDDDAKHGWAIKVHDDEHQVAWFDILFEYDFLYDWYGANYHSLAFYSDAVYFN